MGFHDIQFPVDVSYDTQGGAGWNTNVIELESGSEQTVQRWSSAKRTWDAAYAVKRRATVVLAVNFLNARAGSANTFRFKDWSDYASTADGGVPSTPGPGGAGAGALAATNIDQALGTGNGVLTTFQLAKRYVSGPTTYTRNITKPITSTILISFDTGGGPVNQTSGFSVDGSTGVVTFTTAPANGTVIKWGGQFDCHTRFGEEVDKTGIRWRFVNGDQIDCAPIPIVEVPEGPAIDEDYWSGNASALGVIAASFTVNPFLGRLQVWTVNTASLSATMPAETTMTDGCPIFFAKNDGSQSIQIKRSNGTNEFSIAAGATAIFALVTQTSVKRWYGL